MTMKKIILPNNIAVIEGDSHLTKWVQECGRLDHDPTIARLCECIPAGTTAIDVGSSIGDHTVAYLRKAARVYAFEPNPVAFECLTHNCPGAIRHNVALGSRQGELYWRSSAPNYGASFLSATEQVGDIKVPVLPLDSYLIEGKIGYIKVDVEGWEVEFLKGAAVTIGAQKPVMYIEVNVGALARAGTSDKELLAKLAEYGYNTRPFIPGTDKHEQWDAICMPAKGSA